MLQITDEYLDDLMVRMAHHSTAIEGNSLTQGETKSVLIDNYIPRAMDMRELHEVLNYKNLMPVFKEAISNRQEITAEFIKNLHRILCYEAIEGVPGEFKKIPNMVIGAAFEPTPPYRVSTDLEEWRRNLDAQLKVACGDNATIVEAICRQHLNFEHIHPFSDGNGRVGRALMVYTCLMEKIVPIVIPVERKKEYINYLNNDNVTGLAKFAENIQLAEQVRLRGFQSGKAGKLSVQEVKNGNSALRDKQY